MSILFKIPGADRIDLPSYGIADLQSFWEIAVKLQKRPDHSNVASKIWIWIERTRLVRPITYIRFTSHLYYWIYPLTTSVFLPCQLAIKWSTSRFNSSLLASLDSFRVERWNRYVSVFFMKSWLVTHVLIQDYFFPSFLVQTHSATLSVALDPLSNAQCNHHLAVFLDRIFIGLFPELACPWHFWQE